MNLNNPLEYSATERGKSTALKYPGGEIDWTTLHEAVKRLARGFVKLGVSRGDRVAVMLPNVPHFIIVFYAALRVGAVVVPINTMYKGRETTWLLEDSEARVLVIWQGLWNELSRHISALDSVKHTIVLGESPPSGVISLTHLIAKSNPMPDISNLDGDDSAVIQYTAGVTGTPKGVELTHGNILSNVSACREIMRVDEDDIFLAALPLFRPMGQTLIMHLAIATGATIELHPKFEPEKVLDSILNNTTTLFPAVPSMFFILLDSCESEEPEIKKPLRLCVSGGGAIDEEMLKEFERRFGTYILECYSTAETSPVISFNQWRTGRRVGSLGHPVPGVEMKVVNEKDEEVSIGEVGEIVVKGSNVMRGYINRPRTSNEVIRDGWFHTSDLGKMDINGFFYLVDRLHHRIIKGGFSIYPSEVEAVLYGHPDVAEVAVVPIPDEIMGQEVKACVVLKESAMVTTEQLAEYCRERMALYKVPAVIRFYKDLPHTPTGRVNKVELI